MSKVIKHTKHKRKPSTAIVLSLIMPGCGHIYCGRFVKGLLLSFLSNIFIFLFITTLVFSYSSFKIAIVSLSLSLSVIIELVATIDSYCIAKHARPDYELKDYNRWFVYLLLIMGSMGGAAGLASHVKSNFFEAFIVPVAANYPTIIPHDRILANKLAYGRKDPDRGDMIVFINPENRRQNYIKRVIATAGDTIEIRNNEVFINDQKLERQMLPSSELDQIGIEIEGKPLEGDAFYEINGSAKYKIFLANPPHDQIAHNFAKITVPPHHCFMLGDNRNLSRDSRQVGPISYATIIGRAEYLYYPAKDWSRFGKIDR